MQQHQPSPGTSLIGKVNDERQLSSPENHHNYEYHMSMTRPDKQDVLRLANRNLRLTEHAGKQGEFDWQIKDIPNNENLLDQVD